MGKWVHKMMHKDIKNMSGICAECGFVSLYLNKSSGVYVCSIGKKKGRSTTHSLDHGLTREESLKLKREAVCEICNKKDSLVIDHCHDTLKIRGILCSNCNLGIGHFKDSVVYLKSAISYLSK